MGEPGGPARCREKAEKRRACFWDGPRLLVLSLVGLAIGAQGLPALNYLIDRAFFPKVAADHYYGLLIMGRSLFGTLLGFPTGAAIALLWNGRRKAASQACVVGSGIALLEIGRECFWSGDPLFGFVCYANVAVLWAGALLLASARLWRPRTRPDRA